MDRSSMLINCFEASLFLTATSLTNIRMVYDAYKAIPRELFSGLSNLKLINMGYSGSQLGNGMGLTSIPPQTFRGLSALATLRFHGNEISYLADNVFSGLANLTQLWFGENKISAIKPLIFTGLTSLTDLSMCQDVSQGPGFNVTEFKSYVLAACQCPLAVKFEMC